MYLKSLEMIGFKSFAERTKLEFEPGMMAIVGPNGCGKSNVSDAIRWVLGEQSAKSLRGAAMTDVIFSGTDSAKPLGMAEVSLTLTDCESVLGTDYHEVTITRRVYRSGEGQYFINRAACRLKDIQRLFMDTGIGTNSYSVMEQGRIDQILSSRPDDRREVFEEASGITKYKADKKEALRKLEHTEANLLRLGDIIKEVKRQIISLQRQVGKAKRYKSLQEQLRGLDVWLGKGRLQELNESVSALEKQLETFAKQEEELRIRVESAETETEALRQTMNDVDSKIAAAMDAAGEANSQLARTQELIRVNRERSQELEALSQRDSRETETARASLEAHGNELDILKKDVIAVTDEFERSKKALEETQAVLAAHEGDTSVVRKRLQDFRTEALDLESRLARLQNEWNEIEARERTDLIRRERFAAEKAEAERAVESYAERLSLMGKSLDEKRTASGAMEQQVQDARQAQSDKIGLMNTLRQELNETASAMAARKAQIELLQRNRNEAEGFSAGAKKVLEDSGVLGVDPQKIKGTLAEKIRTDKKHQVALEAAIRSWIDAVLVEDFASAMNLVQELSSRKGGAVRLLTVDASAPKEAASGIGIPLIEKVKAPGEAWPAVQNLLNGVYVVDSAAEIPKEIPPGITLVTRDGIVARADGRLEFWMAGKDESNPLEREHLLSEWQEELAVLQASADEKTSRMKALQADEETHRKNLQDYQTQLETLRREVSLAEGESRMVEREAKQAAERAETIGWELEALVKKTGAGTERRTTISKEMEDIRKRQAEVRNENATDTERLRVLEDKRNELVDDVTERRVEVSANRQRLDGLRSRGEPLEARIRELETLIQERAAGVNTYQTRLAELAAATTEAEGRIEPLQEEMKLRQAELEETRSLRERHHLQLRELDAALHTKRTELDTVREKRGQLDVELAQQRMRRQNIVDRMSVDYQLSPEDVLKEKEPEWEEGQTPPDRDALEMMVAEIRVKLQGMGPVNLVAIEEYQELEERFAFLSQQNDDLVKAKEQLLELIGKINQTTTELFADTFNKVNENFQVLFKGLFEGGDARLTLVDEENILESGIDIIARPPGKKLQSVSLLSGGERTLTALALLFSLFKVKPSAFCLTDELDAALDDQNIGRYLRMLKGFLDTSQFVVITHNRQTIAAAQALYGVTMEKAGISKVVSVKFSSEKEAADAAAEVEKKGWMAKG